jgi:hypothetical protein
MSAARCEPLPWWRRRRWRWTLPPLWRWQVFAYPTITADYFLVGVFWRRDEDRQATLTLGVGWLTLDAFVVGYFTRADAKAVRREQKAGEGWR